MKILRPRFQEIGCLMLVLLFGAFLSFNFFAQPGPAYAEDGTPIRSATEEHFVTIYDQGSTLTVKSSEVTVGELLEQAGVIVSETDLVEPSLTTVVTGDYNINIHRARPVLFISGMERRYIMTASYDPKQIATEAGYTIYDGDTFKTELNNNFLEAGAATTYRLIRGDGQTLTLEESLPYATETRYDYTLPKGESYLEQAGEDGRKISIYAIQFAEGKEVSRELISEEVKINPVPEIVVVGAQVSIPPEQEQCAAWAREAGVAESDLTAALDLMYHESGCRYDAVNAGSGAYGIPQALPGSKMASVGDDWETNPVTQIRWMQNYVTERYGGWQQALDYWWCTGVCTSRMGTITKNSYWY